MRAVCPWPHAMGENCGEWKGPEEPVGSAVYDEFRPRGKLDPLPMLAGAEEGAAGEDKRDPSLREAAVARVQDLVFVILSSNQRLLCCFSNRGEQISMGYFKEIEIRCINDNISISREPNLL